MTPQSFSNSIILFYKAPNGCELSSVCHPKLCLLGTMKIIVLLSRLSADLGLNFERNLWLFCMALFQWTHIYKYFITFSHFTIQSFHTFELLITPCLYIYWLSPTDTLFWLTMFVTILVCGRQQGMHISNLKEISWNIVCNTLTQEIYFIGGYVLNVTANDLQWFSITFRKISPIPFSSCIDYNSMTHIHFTVSEGQKRSPKWSVSQPLNAKEPLQYFTIHSRQNSTQAIQVRRWHLFDNYDLKCT